MNGFLYNLGVGKTFITVIQNPDNYMGINSWMWQNHDIITIITIITTSGTIITIKFIWKTDKITIKKWKYKWENGEISITSDVQMTPPLWQKPKNKEPLDESERWEWKSWLKIQHLKN